MICNYQIVAPVTDRKSPYLDDKDFLIIPNISKVYRYYIEVKRYNPDTLCYEYFLLLSTDKFDTQCKKCRVDDFGRLKAKLHNEIKDYVREEVVARGNIQFKYIESTEYYDVWELI